MRIGTAHARSMVYIGAGLPFGLVTLSPENKGYVWKSGYDYDIPNITGFAHLHANGLGGLLMMPTMGEIKVYPGTPDKPELGYRSSYRHENEVASVGYYAVTLDDYHVRAEMSATTRSGIHSAAPFRRLIRRTSLSIRSIPMSTGCASIKPRFGGSAARRSRAIRTAMPPAQSITGSILSRDSASPSNPSAVGPGRRIPGSPGRKQVIFGYVHEPGGLDRASRWDPAPLAVIHRNADKIATNTRQGLGAFVTFHTESGEAILVKTGISFVSLEDARLNLDREMEAFGWNLEAVRDHDRQIWNKLLGRVEVEGGSESDRTNYTPFSTDRLPAPS
jgi:hypothetical protein